MRDKSSPSQKFARLRNAPENFISDEFVSEVRQHGWDDTRRSFIRKSLMAAGAALAGGGVARAATQNPPDQMITEPRPWSTSLGNPVAFHPYGQPSKYEVNLQRRQSPGLTAVPQASVAFSPLQGMFGIITANGLHFERHHQGWVDVDPTEHRFMINGMVKNPKVYTMDDLMRLPSVSRMHFIECGANTAMEWGNVAVPTVQYTHGMLSCCEFTGVPLKYLLQDCGADFKNAQFILAEGNDGSSETRTISMARAMDDVIVAWGMNGEMLRPENGYPLRLVVPGVQGVSWVKWLRRIEVGDKPWNAKDETLGYVDHMPDGTLRQYTSIQECKSVITSPSGGQALLSKGFYNITGLAWSGRGKIKQVDISVDGGRNWKTATLNTPILDKCLTRFNFAWNWDGSPAILQSRAVDETGYVQPTKSQLVAVRGTRSIYHNNAIQSWKVAESGEVFNVHVE
ncbi:sulfite-dehydrogenase [Advenella kashmirensis WT001]|jgi:sulfane dehydrogenase subunit SoxC|uniref:Sulfite-dehydrogenase n=1 Tax=Advenella kashmirensis (strain DSM 17095 / LMG 22695 / WT001) TaxID=1036672 RepID=I3UAU6_ADVKW|nr:sulfite dehydrogenase [Advenella kashmirensis]AFK62134.1 sulfite-dehydrogenase [Advenella kashmirensis WT001]